MNPVVVMSMNVNELRERENGRCFGREKKVASIPDLEVYALFTSLWLFILLLPILHVRRRERERQTERNEHSLSLIPFVFVFSTIHDDLAVDP